MLKGDMARIEDMYEIKTDRADLNTADTNLFDLNLPATILKKRQQTARGTTTYRTRT